VAPNGPAFTFYLGTHQTHWLGRTEVPLFLSDSRLRKAVRLPRARGRWAKDSGGFSELSLHGKWGICPRAYANRTVRESEEIGGLDWAAPQDWMCEPQILAKTGLSIDQHQQRTVQSVLELRGLTDKVHWIPVLQGWSPGDYLRCVDLYQKAGIDLAREPIVGLGSVCRRQSTKMAASLIDRLSKAIRLHGFGFKMQGLQASAHLLAASDSLAWSFDARRAAPLPGHDKPGQGRRTGHINCANCIEYALRWRARLLNKLRRPPQLDLPWSVASHSANPVVPREPGDDIGYGGGNLFG